MIKTKKGQAALEFLTTYGWAFLVILIMIGALAYFGVLDPERFIPQRCQIAAPFACDGENYQLSDTGTQFAVRIRNSLNKPFTISDIEFRHVSNMTWTNCTATPGATLLPTTGNRTIFPDSVMDLSCSNIETPLATTFVPGSKQRVQFNILYYQDSAAYTKRIAGEIFATVGP